MQRKTSEVDEPISTSKDHSGSEQQKMSFFRSPGWTDGQRMKVIMYVAPFMDGTSENPLSHSVDQSSKLTLCMRPRHDLL